MTIDVEQARADALRVRRAELLCVKEYAALVRRDPKTIYRRIWTGRQPGVVREGRHYLIDLLVALPPVSNHAQ